MVSTAFDEDKNIIYPTRRGQEATCRRCGARMISVIPDKISGKSNFWRHWDDRDEIENYCVDLDPWDKEDQSSEWHRKFQRVIRANRAEYPNPRSPKPGDFRADILGNRDTVIELQHSTSIPIDAIRSRESYYENMIWVLDSTTFLENKKCTCSFAAGQNRIEFAIDQRTKKIRVFEKPTYIHLCCGALAKIINITPDKIILELVYLKDFVDQYLSEFLIAGKDGFDEIADTPALLPEMIDSYDGDCELTYPDCVSLNYSNQIYSRESMRTIQQDEQYNETWKILLKEYELFFFGEVERHQKEYSLPFLFDKILKGTRPTKGYYMGVFTSEMPEKLDELWRGSRLNVSKNVGKYPPHDAPDYAALLRSDLEGYINEIDALQRKCESILEKQRKYRYARFRALVQKRFFDRMRNRLILDYYTGVGVYSGHSCIESISEDMSDDEKIITTIKNLADNTGRAYIGYVNYEVNKIFGYEYSLKIQTLMENGKVKIVDRSYFKVVE